MARRPRGDVNEGGDQTALQGAAVVLQIRPVVQVDDYGGVRVDDVVKRQIGEQVARNGDVHRTRAGNREWRRPSLGMPIVTQSTLDYCASERTLSLTDATMGGAVTPMGDTVLLSGLWQFVLAYLGPV